jgi:TatD DNase family protein
MEFTDTHCHIHFPDYELDPEEVIVAAKNDGVTRMICVGCTLPDSHLGIAMAARHPEIWASIGLHPHEAKEYVHDDHALQEFRDLAARHARPSHADEAQGAGEKQTEPYQEYGEGVSELATQQFAARAGRVSGFAAKPTSTVRKVVAIGECGLDYHYMHSSREDQHKLLRFQLSLAQEHHLPLIFHIRGAEGKENDVFTDFFTIYDEYKGLSGVVHSFSDSKPIVETILKKGLYVGLNGIMTFTKYQNQLEAAKAVPLQKLLLETDAPFLTPAPFRGRVCEPKYVGVTAEFLSNLRDESLEELAAATTRNAKQLFNLQ